MITEDQLKQLCLDWFKSNGYDYVCIYDTGFDAKASFSENDFIMEAVA